MYKCNYISISRLDRRLALPAAICNLRALAKLPRFANENQDWRAEFVALNCCRSRITRNGRKTAETNPR